ncbi:MAG: transglycosylase domain-containing protein, partial [Thermoanaerobaculaceae bacterium]|nr:transglycosylase domain-containing protein [Thermoanaerobaculaceae bacterium]
MDREKKKKIIPALFCTVFLLPFLLFVFFLNYPKIKIFEKGVSGQSLRIYDRNGVLLYETLSEEMSKTRWIQPNSIPPLVEGAVISSEDKRFYKHSGIDPLALLRAVWIDLKSFSI